MDNSKIEWTDATWNPVRGCSIVSKGCKNCYAMKVAHRFSGPGKAYDGLTMMSNAGPVWNGKIKLVPELLDQPLRWRRPRRIFVNSMSDLFHESVPFEFIEKVHDVIREARQHEFQILTKRPERMLEYWQWRQNYFLNQSIVSNPPINAWYGVSVEDQKTADERIPLLLKTPAAVRFLSCEPLLGRVDLCETFGMWWNSTMQCFEGYGERLNRRGREGQSKPGIGWVIVGGESGHSARPMALGWAKDIVHQCKAAGVSVFVKQLGANPTNREGEPCPHIKHNKGADMAEWPEELRVREYPA